MVECLCSVDPLLHLFKVGDSRGEERRTLQTDKIVSHCCYSYTITLDCKASC